MGWVVSPTYPMSEIPERDFVSVCPQAILRRREIGDRRVYDICNGYRVEFRTAENPDRLRGARLAWLWMDEAAQLRKEVMDVLYPCLLAYRGKVWITTTPAGRNWLYDEFYLRSLPDWKDYDSDYSCIRSRTDENPFLDAGDIKKLGHKYTGAFKAQELLAEFVNYEGLVYRDFDVGRHVYSGTPVHPDDKEIARVFAGIDFGFGDPLAYLWVVQFRNHSFMVVDEHYEAGKGTDHHAKRILASPWEKRVEVRFADPRAAQARRDLQRYGVPNMAAHDHEIMDGVLEVTRLLNTDVDGKPLLRVAAECKNLIREFGMYRYRDATDAKNRGEKPFDKDNHALDSLRYALYSIGSNLYHGPAHPVDDKPGPGTYGWIREQMKFSRAYGDSGIFTRRGKNPLFPMSNNSIFNA